MTKNDVLTGYHVKVVLWFIGILFTILMGLIVYIWNDYKTQQSEFNATIKDAFEKHDREISQMKKLFLLQGFDIDEKIDSDKWRNLHEKNKLNSNPRGIQYNNIQKLSGKINFAGE